MKAIGPVNVKVVMDREPWNYSQHLRSDEKPIAVCPVGRSNSKRWDRKMLITSKRLMIIGLEKVSLFKARSAIDWEIAIKSIQKIRYDKPHAGMGAGGPMGPMLAYMAASITHLIIDDGLMEQRISIDENHASELMRIIAYHVKRQRKLEGSMDDRTCVNCFSEIPYDAVICPYCRHDYERT